MPSSYKYQTELLRERGAKHSEAYGATLCTKLEEAAQPLLEWLAYLRGSHLTGTADVLLEGVQAAVLETAGCLSLGIVRPALFSLRAQVDMLLAWLYYKDHPIEWEYIQDTGEGFKLKGALIEYLSSYFPKYKQRIVILKRVKKRKEDDPYRLLSAHIHCQSSSCIPSIGNLDILIRPFEECLECVDIQREVVEYLNDILISCYAERWAAIPKAIVRATTGRLTTAQKKEFYK